MAVAAQSVHYERAGPTLLAMQPSEPVGRPKVDPDWATLRGHLEQRLNQLRTWRQSWWNGNWSDLAQFILPRRSIWLTQSSGGQPSPNNNARGRQINGSIANPTATYAARVCAAGLMSGLASPSRPWFKMVPAINKADIDSAARNWFDETEGRMYKVMASSNFYNALAQEFEDISVFGTGPSIIYEDDKDLIRAYNPAVGEYYLSVDASGRTNGFFRQFVYTMQQMIDFFGVKNCPEDVQKAWQEKGGQLDVERVVAHAIEPNWAIGAGDAGVVKGKFTWREAYWVLGQGTPYPLSLRGFVDVPFTAGRWSQQSNDAYGRSVGMDVLPDVMQLQVMTRRLAEAIEKQVRPPLIGDASLKNQPSSTLPGHLTYVNNMGPGMGIRPIYEVMPDTRGMTELIKEIEARIKTGFFNDLFLMLEQMPTAKMTAFEVSQRMAEKLAVLGPVVEGLLSESLKPKLKRIYGILQRKGMIDPPPPSLQGVPLDVEFVSMLALSQKAAATGGLERLIALVGNMAAVFPHVTDNVDPDAFIREFNDLLGNPEKILHGPEAVQGIRTQNAQAAQKQQQMAAVSQMAEAAGKAAPAAQVLANTQVGAGGNVIGGLLGAGGRQGIT